MNPPRTSMDDNTDLTARLFPVEAVMERLSLGRNSIFNLINSGELRSVKVGRRRLISEQAIRDYVAAIDV